MISLNFNHNLEGPATNKVVFITSHNFEMKSFPTTLIDLTIYFSTPLSTITHVIVTNSISVPIVDIPCSWNCASSMIVLVLSTPFY